MKNFFTLILSLVVAGCGSLTPPDFGPLSSRQPRVLSVVPGEGEVVPIDTKVCVEFSRPIDTASVNSNTLAIVKIDDAGKSDTIVESVVKGKLSGVDGNYEFDDESLKATFMPDSPYAHGSVYNIVATNKIVSTDLLPLNQYPGNSGPFVSGFIIEGSGVTGGSSNDNSNAPGGGTTSSNTGETSGSSPVENANRPLDIVINEVLYDAVGDDTNGQVFVELAGDANADVAGYKLIFVNGDDGKISDTVTFPDNSKISDDGIFLVADAAKGQLSVSNVPGADLIVNFDPQNGPDCVQLLDEKGELVDALGYGSPIVSLAENKLECFEGEPAAKASSGKSLSRTDALDTDNNLSDFQILAVPTPGVR